MRVLFVHQNAPGQFHRLSGALAARGHDVVMVGQHQRQATAGVRFTPYTPGLVRPVHAYLADLNVNTENGYRVFDVLRTLANDNWIPDLVIGHNGWGEMLFVKDALPQVKSVGYFEFFYRASGQDVGFDPEFPPNAEERARLKIRNVTNLLGLDAVDIRWTPTRWQQSVYPAEWQERMQVIHDGIDTQYMSPPASEDGRVLPAAWQVPADAPLITFTARNLEPYRGFHVFMRALPKILRRLPEAYVVIVGGAGASYGRRPRDGGSWKDVLLQNSDADMSRVRVLDRIPYAHLRTLFRASSAHVYLTYPFVLSWSVLEAMACGALVVASRTPPVMEAIADNENGLLFDFFDTEGMVDKVVVAVQDRRTAATLKEAARRETVARFDFEKVCLPAQLDLLQDAVGVHL